MVRARIGRVAIASLVVSALTVGVVAFFVRPWADRGAPPSRAQTIEPGATPAPHQRSSPNAAVPPRYVPPTGPAPRRAGPLSAADVPAPSVLGHGFRTYAGPGGAESGWIGNGTFVRGRDAHEAAFGVLPLGCKHRLDVVLPVPVHALQGSYHGPQAKPAQVVVLDFASQQDAVTYFSGFIAMLANCRAADGPAGLVVHVTARDASTYVGARTYLPAEDWSEVDVRVGRRVAVLLSSIPIVQVHRVATDLRQAVAAR